QSLFQAFNACDGASFLRTTCERTYCVKANSLTPPPPRGTLPVSGRSSQQRHYILSRARPSQSKTKSGPKT
ncbi:MAG: hypothetical protein AAFR01_09215, partial [Pseudomonadota bacterium]